MQQRFRRVHQLTDLPFQKDSKRRNLEISQLQICEQNHLKVPQKLGETSEGAFVSGSNFEGCFFFGEEAYGPIEDVTLWLILRPLYKGGGMNEAGPYTLEDYHRFHISDEIILIILVVWTATSNYRIKALNHQSPVGATAKRQLVNYHNRPFPLYLKKTTFWETFWA